MTKVLVNKIEVTLEEVEVEFPLFFSYSYEGDYGDRNESEIRIDADGRKIAVGWNDYGGHGNRTYEMEVTVIDLQRDLDDYLDSVHQPSDLGKFIAMRAEFIARTAGCCGED